ncbi:MAG: hypothetical protein Q4F72_12560 [Desulfovibrionaceae bacterium]|nr:hypothetical protein [Desulfovibrionaceae bacterium]
MQLSPRKTGGLTAALLMVPMLAAPLMLDAEEAFAAPDGRGPDMRGEGPGPKLTPEQREKAKAIHKKYEGMRRDLHDRETVAQAELRGLQKSGKVRASVDKALQIVDLHKKERAVREDMRRDFRKAGLPFQPSGPDGMRGRPGPRPDDRMPPPDGSVNGRPLPPPDDGMQRGPKPPHDMKDGQKRPPKPMSPADREKFERISDKYSGRLAELGDRRFVKEAELGALRNAGDVAEDAQQRVRDELKELRRERRDLMEQMHSEMKKAGL